MERQLPAPPVEINMKPAAAPSAASAAPRRPSGGNPKSVKPVNRSAKKSAQHLSRSPAHEHNHGPPSPHGLDSRHKRVWKACERCRMKKTKCDGEFPCKRCKDDGLVCTAGTRKKTEYKQLPRGYAEVLEHTQFALIATVHKLYSMVRSGQSWDLPEPEMNDRGQPTIHDIATKLGCIRPNADVDLPPHTVFPEDEAGMAKLAQELEIEQNERDAHAPEQAMEAEPTLGHAERASSSEVDHSDIEQDYRKAFAGPQSAQTLSPQSFTSYSDFEGQSPSTTMFSGPSPTAPGYAQWNMGQPQMPQQFMPQMDFDMSDMMMSQGIVDAEYGTIKPHMMSCSNPDAMLGMADPMIYTGYNMDSLRP